MLPLLVLKLTFLVSKLLLKIAHGLDRSRLSLTHLVGIVDAARKLLYARRADDDVKQGTASRRIVVRYAILEVGLGLGKLLLLLVDLRLGLANLVVDVVQLYLGLVEFLRDLLCLRVQTVKLGLCSAEL